MHLKQLKRKLSSKLVSQGAIFRKALFKELAQPAQQKVQHQIYIAEKLLFQVRYYVVPKCGTTNQIRGGVFLKYVAFCERSTICQWKVYEVGSFSVKYGI